MAWKGARKDKKGKEAEEPPQPPQVPEVPEVPEVPLQPSDQAQTEAKRQRKEAERQLKKADRDLAKMSKRQERAKEAELKHQIAIDKRLRAMERSRTRSVGPVVVALAVFHGIAAAAALLHLYWPERPFYEPLIYPPSAHWELVGFMYLAGVAASVALVAHSPAIDFQQRARYAVWVYFSTALVIAMIGLLLAVILKGMEGMEVDFMPAVWACLVLLGATGLPLLVLQWYSHTYGTSLLLSEAFHRTVGVLYALAGVALVLLPIFLLAQYDLIVKVGISMTMVGALGMFYPLPAMVTTFVAEVFIERTVSGSHYV